MNATITMTEKVIQKMKRLQERFQGDDALDVFKLRRELEAAVFEYHKQGERIPIREFELECELCGADMMNEDEYYLHLRKTHSTPDNEAVEITNRPRTEYEAETNQLSSLLSKYTDYDLEDDFTRGFTGEEETQNPESGIDNV